MFRDDIQAARAIRLLLAHHGVEELWSDTGPTARAALLRYEDDAALPPGTRVLVLAAFGLWSTAAGGVALGDVVRALDPEACRSLCSLIVAYAEGPGAVDAWIAEVTGEIEASEAPPEAGEPSPSPRSIVEGWPTLDILSVRYARRVLSRVEGNRARAASVLGVDRRTLGRLLAPSGAEGLRVRQGGGGRRRA